MSSIEDYLFAQGDANTVQQHQRHHLLAEIAAMDGNRIPNTDVDALARYFRREVPS